MKDIVSNSGLDAVRQVTRKKGKKRPSSHIVGTRGDRAAYLFLLPWLIGFFGLNLIPMLASFILSFTDYNLFGAPQFTGLGNYTYMFNIDWHFPAAVRVTFSYVFFSVPLQLLVSLVLAFVLNKGIKGLTIFRTIFYIPSLLGSSVAVGILWRQLFGMQGLVNIILVRMGASWAEGISWIGNPDFAVWTIILLRVWQFGSPMIIFLAALKQVPSELLESAEIDGARKFTRIWYITLPMISPIIFFNMIMQIISAFKIFTEAFVVSGGATGGGIVGGTLDSLLFYTIHIYSEGFLKFRMGYASALSWLLLLMIAVISYLGFKLSKKWVYYN